MLGAAVARRRLWPRLRLGERLWVGLRPGPRLGFVVGAAAAGVLALLHEAHVRPVALAVAASAVLLPPLAALLLVVCWGIDR